MVRYIVLEPSPPKQGTHPPAREGSVMSHYVRPVVVKRALGSPYGKIYSVGTLSP